MSALNNRLLSFRHSDFSDIVDLRAISEHCSNLTFLAVNAAALAISGDTYIDNNILYGETTVEEIEVETFRKNGYRNFLFPRLKGKIR